MYLSLWMQHPVVTELSCSFILTCMSMLLLIFVSPSLALQFKSASDWVDLHWDGVQPQISKSYSVTTTWVIICSSNHDGSAASLLKPGTFFIQTNACCLQALVKGVELITDRYISLYFVNQSFWNHQLLTVEVNKIIPVMEMATWWQWCPSPQHKNCRGTKASACHGQPTTNQEKQPTEIKYRNYKYSNFWLGGQLATSLLNQTLA